jgi:hypothetical protein
MNNAVKVILLVVIGMLPALADYVEIGAGGGVSLLRPFCGT